MRRKMRCVRELLHWLQTGYGLFIAVKYQVYCRVQGGKQCIFFKKKIGQLFTRDACNYLSEGVPQSLVAIFIWVVDLYCILL